MPFCAADNEVDGRRSGVSFGAQAGAVRGSHSTGLPRRFYALRSGQAASVFAPVAAPGTAPRRHAPLAYSLSKWDTSSVRWKLNVADLTRFLHNDLATIGRMFDTSERPFMGPNASRCSPTRNGPIRAVSSGALRLDLDRPSLRPI